MLAMSALSRISPLLVLVMTRRVAAARTIRTIRKASLMTPCRKQRVAQEEKARMATSIFHKWRRLTLANFQVPLLMSSFVPDSAHLILLISRWHCPITTCSLNDTTHTAVKPHETRAQADKQQSCSLPRAPALFLPTDPRRDRLAACAATRVDATHPHDPFPRTLLALYPPSFP